MTLSTPAGHRATAKLLKDVRACELCAAFLPLAPRPVLQVHAHAPILIAGHAPGSKVHQTGIPFDEPSGDRLRDWMGIDKATFYDETKIAILPMGFCYPGTGKSGDLPPLPHPSPRNNIWLKRNDWFEAAVLPSLKRRVQKILR